MSAPSTQNSQQSPSLARILGLNAAAFALCYPIAAFALAFWPAPVFADAPRIPDTVLAMIERAAAERDVAHPFETREFVTRDGERINARVYGEGRDMLLLVHGIGSSASNQAEPAALLSEATGNRVLAIDLRGHGESGGRPRNIDHVGQYEEDLADIVRELRTDNDRAKIVLAGHSMGGGIALRYALSKNAPDVDGYLLIAPLLGEPAPTMRRPTDEEAELAEQYMKVRSLRLIGVSMFDAVGVNLLSSLPVLYLNAPGMPEYGYAAVMGMQPNPPNDYRAALAAIDAPLLLVAGENDEAFIASAYDQVIREHSRGEAVLITQATHSGIQTDSRAISVMSQWVASIAQPEPRRQ